MTEEEKFLDSPIFALQQQNNKRWNYSLCETPIKRNQAILLGINWGVDDDHEP